MSSCRRLIAITFFQQTRTWYSHLSMVQPTLFDVIITFWNVCEETIVFSLSFSVCMKNGFNSHDPFDILIIPHTSSDNYYLRITHRPAFLILLRPLFWCNSTACTLLDVFHLKRISNGILMRLKMCFLSYIERTLKSYFFLRVSRTARTKRGCFIWTVQTHIDTQIDTIFIDICFYL